MFAEHSLPSPRASGSLMWGVAPVILSGLFALQSGATTFTVSNISDSGAGSLRQAILDANAASGLDTIVFQIPGSGVHTIALLSTLPPITDPIVIDGTTQTGFTNKPVIELNGANAGNNAGLRVLAGNCTIRGLAINRFGADGIRIEASAATNFIVGNFIGTDPTGLIGRGNTNGVLVNGSSGNVIGGTNPADRNLIAANTDTGLYLLNGSNNVVQGNLIGTTITGTNRLGNLNNGIVLYNDPGNLIGGATTAARNIVSANGTSGIYLFGSGATANLIQGNYIGTDATGSVPLGNAADGITLAGAGANTIGGIGTTGAAGNLISGNGHAGVFLNGVGVAGNVIQGNFIGTDASGRLAVGNTLAGVTISDASSNLVGGATVAARNVISGNKQDGVFITTNGTANLVEGNFIGTDATGTNALGNLFNGISISAAASNTVGGATAGARNVISGNLSYGVQLFPTATANVIQGNFIGPDLNGRSALSNHLSGVRIESPTNTIGGPLAGAGNLISGNGQDGILLVGPAAMGNVVQGNSIGTGPRGTNALGNFRAGVGISDAPANTIGGITAGAGNLLSGNADAGIYLIGSGASLNEIQGNRIGTDSSGSSALGNGLEGIYIERAQTNNIGGTLSGAGNLISANNTRGIFLTNASWNVIQGNLIGTKNDGLTALGNGVHAVELEVGSSHNTIGGGAGAGNRIAFSPNGFAGVRIRDGSTNNGILSNAIFSNGALGIDLGAAGVTPNDPCDTDTGANMSQNFPVLVQAVGGPRTVIRGTLNSAPGAAFVLQFFASSACDPSGYGEGQLYLGDLTVVTSNNCTASFVATLAESVPIGNVITATATDAANNTSEFSACVPVAPIPSLGVVASSNHQVNLAWTNSAGGFVLKQTGSLSPPIQWTTVTNSPIPTNGQYVVTLNITNGNKFFLLSFE